MKHIAFCKIGKSIKFASAFSPIGGDNEAPSLLRLLANNNPDITFHIVGRSDFYKLSQKERVSLFNYDNVVDTFEGKRGAADEDTIIDYFNDLGFQPDACISMVGQVGTVTIPNRIQQVKDPSLFASVIDMTKNYTTPIVKWWNENLDMKLVEIINDPRYVLNQSRDLIINPTVSLSQYEGTYTKNTMLSYEDQERVPREIPMVYAGVERIFQYDREFKKATADGRDTNFMVVLNEGSPSRYNTLKEWVLNKIDDVEIYGKWDHKNTVDDTRFKGSMKLEELQDKLKKVRATFIIPIAPGWTTSKYIEMIHAGVIPFFHESYDTQNHTKVPSWLRIKSAEQFAESLKLIENDSVYEKMITELQDMFCTEEYYNGKVLNNTVMSNTISGYKSPDLTKYNKAEVKPEGLEGFF